MEINLNQQQAQKKRNSALEILRLLAMGIIIFYHFVVHGIFLAVSIQQHHTLGVLISLLVGWLLGKQLVHFIDRLFFCTEKAFSKTVGDAAGDHGILFAGHCSDLEEPASFATGRNKKGVFPFLVWV